MNTFIKCLTFFRLNIHFFIFSVFILSSLIPRENIRFFLQNKLQRQQAIRQKHWVMTCLCFFSSRHLESLESINYAFRSLHGGGPVWSSPWQDISALWERALDQSQAMGCQLQLLPNSGSWANALTRVLVFLC